MSMNTIASVVAVPRPSGGPVSNIGGITNWVSTRERYNGKIVLKRGAQTGWRDGRWDTTDFPLNSPANLAWTSTVTDEYRVSSSQLLVLKRLFLVFTLKNNGVAAMSLPSPIRAMWDKHEVYTNGGQFLATAQEGFLKDFGLALQKSKSELLEFYRNNYNADVRTVVNLTQAASANANIAAATAFVQPSIGIFPQRDSSTDRVLTTGVLPYQDLAAGVSKVFVMELDTQFLEDGNLCPAAMSDGREFIFKFYRKANPLNWGTNADLQITQQLLRIMGPTITQQDLAVMKADLLGKTINFNTVQSIQQTYPLTIATTAQKVRMELTPFVGSAFAILIFISDQIPSTANNTLWDAINPAYSVAGASRNEDNVAINIEDASGRPYFGLTPDGFKWRTLRQWYNWIGLENKDVMTVPAPNPLFNALPSNPVHTQYTQHQQPNVLLLPFCDNFSQAMTGSPNGSVDFDGKQFLTLTTNLDAGTYNVTVVGLFTRSLVMQNGTFVATGLNQEMN